MSSRHTYSSLIFQSSLWYFPLWHHPITFSGITYHHFLYSFPVFSLIIAYLTLSLFYLEWWFFTCHWIEDCHILSPRSPNGQWFRDLSLRSCLVSEDSCYIRIWRGFDHLGMYFHGRSFIIDQSMRKKKIAHSSLYHSPLGMCIDVPVCFIESICYIEFVWELISKILSLYIFWLRVWVAHSIFVRETCDLSLVSLDLCSIHHPTYFWCDYFPCFDVGWLSLIFFISLFPSIFVLLLYFTLPHLISFFSHPTWCLTVVQHPHFILAYLMCPFLYHCFSRGDP